MTVNKVRRFERFTSADEWRNMRVGEVPSAPTINETERHRWTPIRSGVKA
jgi:hypothetical protein